MRMTRWLADHADNPQEPTDDPSLDQDGDCGITADDVVIVMVHVGEYVEP
jgi:hypothetical protein